MTMQGQQAGQGRGPLRAVDVRAGGAGGIEAPARLKIVDTDVHHGPLAMSELAPYLSATYNDRLRDYGFGGVGSGYADNGGLRGWRADMQASKDGFARPVAGGAPAWEIEQVQQQLLDGCNIDIAILTGATVYSAAALPDADYGAALCRAFNDYTLEHWLARDDRFRYTMAVYPQDPVGAVKEIERIGSNPQICAVMMPGGALRPFGNRLYHPIYEACVKHNLAVAIHFGAEGNGINPPISASGYPSYYIESRLMRPSFYQVNIASFIFEGVFERFPTLKVGLLESGFAWVPAYLWRMDTDWKGLRTQTPWVKRLPSEYFVDHIRIGTQPMEDPEPASALQSLLEWCHADRTLMFASDYPHWDWDDPAATFQSIPPALRQRMFADNAADCFGL